MGEKKENAANCCEASNITLASYIDPISQITIVLKFEMKIF